MIAWSFFQCKFRLIEQILNISKKRVIRKDVSIDTCIEKLVKSKYDIKRMRYLYYLFTKKMLVSQIL